MNELHVADLGRTPYREGLAIQDALVRARADGVTGDWLLFPEHESVLTIGRSPSEGSLRADAGTLAARGIEVFEVPRGGDVTWHGPGQMVAYPIVALERVDRDLHRWLRTLEDAVLETLARWGLAGRRVSGRTGVWLSEREKVASIGVAVRRWVGYHGVALNVRNDLSAFELIHPCGLHDIRMTSMAERLGPACPPLGEVQEAFARALAARLGYTSVQHSPAAEVRALAGTALAADTSNMRVPRAGARPPFVSQGDALPWST